MNPILQRAILLFEQSRFKLAEPELRQVLAGDPDDAYAHALLALCLARREEWDEATREAKQAVHLAPDSGFPHYSLASILHDRRRYDEASAAVSEALRLDPEDADYCGLLSQIRLDQRDWPAALDAAERGLQFDPGHVSCTNLRAIALTKLGRKAEAGATIDAALARDPDDAVTHATRGWAYLERSDSQKALEHFREALRLDPTNEWARAGIVEALKAKNIVYGLLLRYFLWMSKLSTAVQWGVLIAGYVLNRALGAAAEANQALAPWLLPFRIAYLALVLLTWTADPLFNLLLRVNRFGRLALSEEQTTASTWFGATVFPALASLALCFVLGFDGVLLLSALVFGLLMIPVAGMFKAAQGWPRTVLMSYTAGLAATGLAALGFFGLAAAQGGGVDREWLALGRGTLGLFITASIVFMWGANLIIPIRPKR